MMHGHPSQKHSAVCNGGLKTGHWATIETMAEGEEKSRCGPKLGPMHRSPFSAKFAKVLDDLRVY